MFNELLQKSRQKMTDTLGSLQRDMDSISTGRATPNILDPIKAEVYGSPMPLDQLATISIPESTTISIQVWDRSNIKAVEKAIINSNLGFNPLVDGQTIRIAIPKLSQERRIELAKLAKKYGEDKKIAIRNIRRDIIDDFKKSDDSASKDQVHGFSDEVQKITDEFVTKIDEIVAKKEKDLMKI
ncbi:MAG: ribosome recycling factor [Rickettsiales bacterium]|nr:ribosome recycling factor [Rickettsiales bacterium]